MSDPATDTAAAAVRDEQARTSALLASLPRAVETVAQYDAAAAVLREIKQRRRDVDDLRRSITRPLDDAKTRVMDLFKPLEDALQQGEQNLKDRMLAYQEAEERRVREEREANEAHSAALEAASFRAMEDGRYDDAQALQEERDALRDPEPAYKARDKWGRKPAPGTSTSTRWYAEVTDMALLAQAVANEQAPSGVLLPNQKVLDALARAKKGPSDIPGVRFYSKRLLAATGTR